MIIDELMFLFTKCNIKGSNTNKANDKYIKNEYTILNLVREEEALK